ncbi:hypothetical protein [Crassaminicella profunda]|uniref:hypothetical protein n=1 Tax=Crassaminicella profunda TaxID=1286698 RepID=UPI001CA72A6B|nr:hypothetical protein [Crassaminicella profunda]QZY54053.1 hypothetical protein K7H06_13430 [Crassaminicella profunda]
MQVFFKFKDGMDIEQVVGAGNSNAENGEKLLEMLKDAKEKKGAIDICIGENKLERRFDELYSVEILMD